MWGSTLANAALFALLFPAVSFLFLLGASFLCRRLQYIIMAMHARPMPIDPYSPLGSSASERTTRHPSPFIPIRLPIFAVVISLNDWIVRVISVVGGGGRNRSTGRVPGRGRAMSDGVENAEEGIELDAFGRKAGGLGRRKID